MELNGPAIVTGAASGIGRAIALAFARYHCPGLTLVDINTEGLEETERLIHQSFPSIVVFLITRDLTDESAPDTIVRQTVDQFNSLSYLVNCAGIPGAFGTSQNLTVGEFDKIQQLNVRATWQLQKASVRQMLLQKLTSGQRGAIVNVGSMVSHVGSPSLSAYVTSKHAVLGLTRAEALDFASQGIRVNCVSPGFIDTNPARDNSNEPTNPHLQKIIDSTPMGRAGTAGEVAGCVVFLCSGLASYITGASLAVDGGFTAA